MKTIRETFHGIFNNKVDALGLSVFRIIYSVILFCEAWDLFTFRHVIYDAIPFKYRGEVEILLLFLTWFVVITFLMLGLFTRTVAILNFVIGILIFSGASAFEYHVFYAYLGVNFLLLFMPISRVFSLDSLIQKVKYTNLGRPYSVDRNVLEINYLMPVFLVIGLVYIDSIFYKVTSPMWMDGLGMWMPSSLPMVTWTDTSWILNQEYLVKFFGYVVLVFETVFIFLFWFKRFRVPFFFLGVFFHLGILIAYPIPWFALAVVGVYFLLVPPGFWTKLSAFFKSKKTTFKFYYDAECPLCNKVVVVIRHFDVFKKIDCVTVQGHAAQDSALAGISEEDLLINIYGVSNSGKVYKGYRAYLAMMRHMIYTAPLGWLLNLPGISHLGDRIYRYVAGNRLTERCTAENCSMPVLQRPIPETQDVMVAGWNRLSLTQAFWKWTIYIFSAVQICLILTGPLFMKPFEDTNFSRGVYNTSKIVFAPFKKLLGVTSHPVFMYNIHFDSYNHIFKFVCNENGKRVPLLDDNGMVTDSYANGSRWVNYTFRGSSPLMVRDVFEPANYRYLRHFQREHGVDKQESSFTIYVKEIETTDHWQHDFLHNQMKKPWKVAGTCTVSPEGFRYDWTDEMKSVFEKDEDNNKNRKKSE